MQHSANAEQKYVHGCVRMAVSVLHGGSCLGVVPDLCEQVLVIGLPRRDVVLSVQS